MRRNLFRRLPAFLFCIRLNIIFVCPLCINFNFFLIVLNGTNKLYTLFEWPFLFLWWPILLFLYLFLYFLHCFRVPQSVANVPILQMYLLMSDILPCQSPLPTCQSCKTLALYWVPFLWCGNHGYILWFYNTI